MTLQRREGRVEVPGGRVFYRVVGNGPGTPLLTLHGGPGSGLVSMRPFQALGNERPVVFYDQLGCGRSDVPRDPRLWHPARFVEEIDTLRKALQLDEVHLVGHSWGGMLAIDYLLARPSGVKSVVFTNTLASVATLCDEIWRLVDALPRWARDSLRTHRPNERGGSLRYQLALAMYRLRHIVRPWHFPNLWPILHSTLVMSLSPTYAVMWGHDELHATGVLADWDRVARLSEIEVSALVLAGEYDETTPRLARQLASGLQSARMHILKGCSHLSFFERPREYMDLVRSFLHTHET